jgi:Protein of unknown function (DUF3142)
MMRKRIPFALKVGSAALLAIAALVGHAFWRASSSPNDTHRRLGAIPRLVLWAWEQPEDLRFIDARHVGVAFLASTVNLSGNKASIRPRFQRLLVPEDAKLIAVVRIEAGQDATLDSRQRDAVVRNVVAVSSLPRVSAVQIDFDATKSQRAFYQDVLVHLRNALPPSMPISITALASWCMGDNWIASLPIDEAVPMLFRLGAGTNEVATWLASGRDFSAPICRDSLGVSTDEPWTKLPAGRRIYVFRVKPWTAQAQLALSWELPR